MKKIIDYLDFLWKGDKDMLITMWLTIGLAIILLIDLCVTIDVLFLNPKQ